MEIKEIYGGYKVSSCGKVFSKKTGQMMSPHDNGRGYLIVSLRVEGTSLTKAVHRLVAEAFIDNPDNLPEVDHKDANKLNNHHTNLRWITRGGNIKHAYDKSCRSATGENNARCKTNLITVEQICSLLACGFKASRIRDLGYKYGLVRAIKSKRNWRHISRHYF